MIVDTANHADGGLGFQAYGYSRRFSYAQGEAVRAQIRAGTLIPRIPLEIDYELARTWNTVGRGIRIEVAYTSPYDVTHETPVPWAAVPEQAALEEAQPEQTALD